MHAQDIVSSHRSRVGAGTAYSGEGGTQAAEGGAGRQA